MTLQDPTLAERYGTDSPVRRRVIRAISVAAAVAALGWLGWVMVSHAAPPVDSELVSFDVIDEHTVDVRVEVRVQDDAEDVNCLLRAFAEDHVTVGEHSFSPEVGDATVVEKVRTERRATSVELLGCTAQGQPRPS